MKSFRVAVAMLASVIAIGSWATVGSGQAPQGNPQLPGAPLGGSGEAIFPAFEAWGPVKDGTNTILVGYFNRNKAALDIPVGPNNRLEPGGPDMGQPTHFLPGRHYGTFSIQTPKDFGNKKITWTIVANGQTSAVQLSLNKPYWVDFFRNPSTGNTPPTVRMSQNGPELSGPPLGYAQTLTASVNQPLALKVWVSDKPNTYDPEEGLPDSARSRPRPGTAAADGDAAGGRGRGAARGGAAPQPNFDISAAGGGRGRGGRGGTPADIVVTWKPHRKPGPLTFSEETQRFQNRGNINAVFEAATNATFGAPGEYVVRAQVNDATGDGGGGDQCCWTTAHVKVTVK
jgi:hypothetical protein